MVRSQQRVKSLYLFHGMHAPRRSSCCSSVSDARIVEELIFIVRKCPGMVAVAWANAAENSKEHVAG